MFSENAVYILNRLVEYGYEAYLVGGCVRDMLMKREISDYDIATNARPDEMKKVFSDLKLIETGIKHGTVTVLYNGISFEITTYRNDGEYTDNRHPDSVRFANSLKDDVSRRDFTVNSIAWSDSGIKDYYGGINDIENKCIRCVGDPAARFKEDALRILRALRFASVLGFDIEENTKSAIFKCKDLISHVSAERIFTEFTKLICGENSAKVIEEYAEVIGVFIPEVYRMKGFLQRSRYHKYDVLKHCLVALENVEPVPFLRYAALLHDVGKPDTFTVDEKGEGHFYGHQNRSYDICLEIMHRLKADNELTEKVSLLVKYHDLPIENDRKLIKKRLSKMGEEMFFEFMKIYRADRLAHADAYIGSEKEINDIIVTAKDIIEEKECFSRKSLAIDGNDIIHLGAKGKQIGDVLSACLDAVIDGKISNIKEELLEYAKKIVVK